MHFLTIQRTTVLVAMFSGVKIQASNTKNRAIHFLKFQVVLSVILKISSASNIFSRAANHFLSNFFF